MIWMLMLIIVCRLWLLNLIFFGSRSSFGRNILVEVKGIKYNRDVECGLFYFKFLVLLVE